MIRWRRPILAVLALCGTTRAPALGQQVAGGWRHASVLTAADQCDNCHTPHVRSNGGRMLKGEPGGGRVRAWLQAQAPGAGDPSLACLRCHWTGQGRVQSPEFAAAPPDSGRFVGPDLADDHLLGSTDPTTPRLHAGGTPWLSPSRAMSDRDVIECTTCHDPHTAGAAVPQGAKLQRLCGNCHPMEAASLDRHVAVSCGGCHQLHNARQAPLLRETTVELMCTRCHVASGASQAGRMENQRAAEGTVMTLTPSHNPGSNCLQCHTLHRGR